MPEPIGIGTTMDAMNNLNVKTFLDLVIGQAVSNNQQSQTQYNKHIARIDAIAEASLTNQLRGMNSFDPVEAAAYSRMTRTPTGDAKSDVAAGIAMAQELLRPGKQYWVPGGGVNPNPEG